jgi:anaphase-promoting complex subunit 4
MDVVDSLTLLGHRILLVVMDELEHFASFSTWLRFQIDRLHSSSSEDRNELTEKEATMDTGKVLTYIERYLTDSPLRVFFDEIAKEDHAEAWQHTEDVPRLLDVLDTQLRRQETGDKAIKAVFHVEFLVDLAHFWSDRVLDDIAEAKKRSVRLGKPVKLTVGAKVDCYDVRMCEESTTVRAPCSNLFFLYPRRSIYTAH